MSLASVLVTSAKVRSLALKVLASASAAALALGSIAVLQQVQRRLDREFLAADPETQAGNGLIEQPVPGGVTALGFFMEQLLDAIFELIRLVLAQILDPGTIMRELRRL